MRRSYISPEFLYNNVNGTLNMGEQSSFFGSKMLEIDDVISILNDNLVYYQINNEQTNLSLESTTTPFVYNTIDEKGKLHTLKSDEFQTPSQLDGNTKWIMEVNIRDVLRGYIFSSIKKYRTFEGVKNTMSLYNDVNVSINEYIDKNILNRYQFKTIDFYISYNDLRGQNVLRYKNIYTQNIENINNISHKIETILDVNNTSIKVLFSQEKPSNLYSFNYYFNLFFEKI